MTRRLTAHRPVTGDALTVEEFTADPGHWLPRPARRRGLDRWTTNLGAGPLTRSVTCHVGAVWRVGDEVWRSVSWEPQSERDDIVAVDRLLPVFRGELGIHADGEGLRLILRGGYVPPAGRIGAAADATALGRIAQVTAERFLVDIATRLRQVLPHPTEPDHENLAESLV